MSNQYTPGKWLVGSETDPHWMREVRDERGRGIVWCGSFPAAEAHANVRRIVQCVNAHDALEKALRLFIAAGFGNSIDPVMHAKAYDAARALLHFQPE